MAKNPHGRKKQLLQKLFPVPSFSSFQLGSIQKRQEKNDRNLTGHNLPNFVNCQMLTTPEKFEMELNGVKMSVQELDLPGHTAFRVMFSSNRKPIIVTRTKDYDRVFWTSVPEGRQSEAEGVGALIEEYFKKKDK